MDCDGQAGVSPFEFGNLGSIRIIVREREYASEEAQRGKVFVSRNAPIEDGEILPKKEQILFYVFRLLCAVCARCFPCSYWCGIDYLPAPPRAPRRCSRRARGDRQKRPRYAGIFGSCRPVRKKTRCERMNSRLHRGVIPLHVGRPLPLKVYLAIEGRVLTIMRPF